MKTTNKKWFYIRRGIAIGLLALLLLLMPLSATAETYVKDNYTWVMDGTTSVAVNVFDASLNVIHPQFYHSSYTTDGITRHLYSLPDNAPFAPANGAWFQIEWSVDLDNEWSSFIGDGKRVEFIYFVRDGYDYIGTDYVIDGDAINPGKSSYVRFGSTKVYLDQATEVKKYANYTGYRYSVPCPSGTVSVDEVYFSAFYRGNGQSSVWSNCFSDIYLRSYTDNPLVGEGFEPLPDQEIKDEYATLEGEALDTVNGDQIDDILNNRVSSYNSITTAMLSIKGLYNAFANRFPTIRWIIDISLSLGLSAFVLNLVITGIGALSRKRGD